MKRILVLMVLSLFFMGYSKDDAEIDDKSIIGNLLMLTAMNGVI